MRACQLDRETCCHECAANTIELEFQIKKNSTKSKKTYFLGRSCHLRCLSVASSRTGIAFSADQETRPVAYKFGDFFFHISSKWIKAENSSDINESSHCLANVRVHLERHMDMALVQDSLLVDIASEWNSADAVLVWKKEFSIAMINALELRNPKPILRDKTR